MRFIKSVINDFESKEHGPIIPSFFKHSNGSCWAFPQ